MPSRQVLEKRANSDMQEENSDDQYAQEPREERMPTPQLDAETEDADMSEKKDRPPRFSTLFGVAPTLPAREFESYPEPQRKSGIWMPTPLFVLFAVILLFESTLLFAYAIIGLYSNLGLVPSGPASCNCESNRPAINIAPNFVMPQAQAPIMQTTTVTVLGNGLLSDLLPAPTIPPSSGITMSTSTGSSTTADSSPQAAAIASNVLGMLNSIATAPSSMTGSTSITRVPGVATSTMILSQIPPPQSTVNSVKLVTVNPSGSTILARPTVTATTVIDPSQAAAANSASAVAQSSVETAFAGLAKALTPHVIPSSTTFATSVASTTAPPATTVSLP
ncbi:hypothetical protein B0A55_03142 [Friedmanniomyces simplex]|uniref:Uncharacterized protein n=1 Tax=Friedmanniomyces simplex TaxID=329884 RepID=A0A4U0XRL6_9PEZI|nr:hypothetical protein B0A55_03142 [Friedmanniomyces simplex]